MERIALKAADVEAGVAKLCREVLARAREAGEADALAVVAIRRGGVRLAARLRARLGRELGRELPAGTLDIALYRDDLAQRGTAPVIGPDRDLLPARRADGGPGRRRPLHGPDRARRARRAGRLRPAAPGLARGPRRPRRARAARRRRLRRRAAGRRAGGRRPGSFEGRRRAGGRGGRHAEEGAVIGRQKHCIALADYSREELLQVLDLAANMKEVLRRPIKKVPSLRGKSIINLFFEASTRTRSSFEIAAKVLSADALNWTPATRP